MDGVDHDAPLRIGELAAACGLHPKTIRYYEAIGLLPLPRRTPCGHRRYRRADRERLHFVAKAKALGLTLEEIGRILALRGTGERPCAHVRAVLARKLAEVDRQIRALAAFRQELAALLDDAGETGDAGAPVCGIIERHEPARHAGPAPEAIVLAARWSSRRP